MKRLLLLCSLLFSLSLSAQPYFQQRVDTRIDVALDDKSHFLRGLEHFVYTNRSPDSLSVIYVHLWPNAYSTDRTKFAEQQVLNKSTAFYFSKTEDRGFIDSLDFQVDGESASITSLPGFPDIVRLELPKPVLPGAKITVSTPFRVKIPKVYSRMGHSKQAYYISQWFPKPAVYDRKGWHPLPYSDQGEFYSEVGSYDVSITLPKNYVVMATGNCSDASENAWLDSLASLPFPDSSRFADSRKRDSFNRFPASSEELKTIHFHEDNVHDFAWFADKRFLVRKDTMVVNGNREIPTHTVTIWAAMLPAESRYWRKATSYMKQTVAYLSEHVGPYPYNTVKAVEGDMKAGGGMEYPTVTVIDRLASRSLVMEVIVHEVGHNWFYGLLATNEREHAWMDEGLNTFYEQRISRNIKVPEENAVEHYTNKIEDVLYYNAASSGIDQTLSQNATMYTQGNYGQDNYYKTALLLRWLEDYMGRANFRVAMQDYFNEWHYRHPYPEDMREVFQRNTTKSLDWFFEGALKTSRAIDFSIKGVRKRGDSLQFRVVNNSDFAAPVRINARRDSVNVDSLWTAPFSGSKTLRMAKVDADIWRVSANIPEAKISNSFYEPKGIFHTRKYGFGLGLGLGRQISTKTYLLPAVGYNMYDGFGAGLLLHNLAVPQSKLRYALAPMYSVNSKTFTGAGSVGYWFYPKRVFQEIVPQIDAKTFHYDESSLNIPERIVARYTKIAPSLSFVFKNRNPLSTVTRSLMLKGYAISEEKFDFTRTDTSQPFRASMGETVRKTYGMLRYTHRNDRTFNPFSYQFEAQAGDAFVKLGLEGKARIDYNQRNKALYIRAYAGKYIDLSPGVTGDEARYWLNVGYTGAFDYLYDGTYIGRNQREGFAARQVSIQEGGGKLNTPLYGFPLGRSDDWLASLNLKSDLPLGRLPVRLYLDVATYADAAKISPNASRFLYTGGLEIHALRDIFLLHIPLVMSGEYRDYLKSMYPGKTFGNSISFAIQLQNINWLRSISSGMKYYLN